MNNLTVARRYAQALYQEAESEQRVEQVDADMDLIRDTLDGSRDLVAFFASPIISREKKESVVQSLFAEPLNKTTYNFLRLLIEKKREALFPDVVRAYRDLRDEQRGIVEARAKVAYPLTEAEEQTLVQALEKLSGAQVRLQVDEDRTLVGGLIVRMGDTVYDGSVRNQLANLRERMELGSVTMN
jgi:F-type H+-transporting ATPase subunit delta